MLWQGPTAYTKTVRHEDLQGGGKGSRTTDPKSRCLKGIQMEIFSGVGCFCLLDSCEL